MKDEKLTALKALAKSFIDWDLVKTNYPDFNSFLPAFGRINSLFNLDMLTAHYLLVIIKEFYEDPEVVKSW